VRVAAKGIELANEAHRAIEATSTAVHVVEATRVAETGTKVVEGARTIEEAARTTEAGAHGVEAAAHTGEAARAGEEGAQATKSARREPIEGHHSDPKFMGGDPKQPLTDLPRSTHRGEEGLHNDLNKFLKERKNELGHDMAPRRGNPGSKVRDNFSREERLRALADFYKKFYDKYPKVAEDFFKQHPHLRE